MSALLPRKLARLAVEVNVVCLLYNEKGGNGVRLLLEVYCHYIVLTRYYLCAQQSYKCHRHEVTSARIDHTSPRRAVDRRQPPGPDNPQPSTSRSPRISTPASPHSYSAAAPYRNNFKENNDWWYVGTPGIDQRKPSAIKDIAYSQGKMEEEKKPHQNTYTRSRQRRVACRSTRLSFLLENFKSINRALVRKIQSILWQPTPRVVAFLGHIALRPWCTSAP